MNIKKRSVDGADKWVYDSTIMVKKAARPRPDLRIVGGTESRQYFENSCVLSPGEIDGVIAILDELMRKDGKVVLAHHFCPDVDEMLDILCRNVCRMTPEQLKAFEELA